jgi:hypothetical protein
MNDRKQFLYKHRNKYTNGSIQYTYILYGKCNQKQEQVDFLYGVVVHGLGTNWVAYNLLIFGCLL